jgi:hypothetical protein
VGRGAHRRHPDNVYAKTFQIIDLADDAADVTQSVSIGVLEAGWVDLVNDTFLPPEFLSTVCHGAEVVGIRGMCGYVECRFIGVEPRYRVDSGRPGVYFRRPEKSQSAVEQPSYEM